MFVFPLNAMKIISVKHGNGFPRLDKCWRGDFDCIHRNSRFNAEKCFCFNFAKYCFIESSEKKTSRANV